MRGTNWRQRCTIQERLGRDLQEEIGVIFQLREITGSGL
jgi:hypothetical protein